MPKIQFFLSFYLFLILTILFNSLILNNFKISLCAKLLNLRNLLKKVNIYAKFMAKSLCFRFLSWYILCRN